MKNPLRLLLIFLIASTAILFTGAVEDETALKKKAAEAYRNNFLATEISSPDQLGWTGKSGSCKPGKISIEAREKLLKRINYFRSLAGVHNTIVLDSLWNQYAQAAAMIMHSNNTLTHDPGPGMKCYSKDGKAGAATSNLSSIVDASIKLLIADEIQDGGTNNKDCGHRRWLLYSKAVKMGVGATPGAYAVRVMQPYEDDQKDTMSFHGTVPEYFGYPFQGYVPYQLIYPKWSFAVPGEVDFATAKVELIAGDKPLSCTIISRGKVDYGDPTLIWTVRGLKEDFEYNYYDMAEKKKAFEQLGLLDKKVTVKISGVKIGGKVKSYSYSFNVFNPDEN